MKDGIMRRSSKCYEQRESQIRSLIVRLYFCPTKDTTFNMRSLLEKTRELSRRYNGLQATKDLFPEEYCQLNSNLILNDDALEQIDVRLIDLLNEHCFPCFDIDRDYSKKTRERPYTGLGKISICPSGFDSYADYTTTMAKVLAGILCG